MRLLSASNSLKTLDLFIKNAKHVPRELSVEYQKLVHRGHCAYHKRQGPWEPWAGGRGQVKQLPLPPHCVLKYRFIPKFPENLDASVKLNFDTIL